MAGTLELLGAGHCEGPVGQFDDGGDFVQADVGGAEFHPIVVRAFGDGTADGAGFAEVRVGVGASAGAGG